MKLFWAIVMASLATGCGAPEPPGSTGGTQVTPGVCGRGISVVHTDYQSTNVSLVDWAGRVLSSSFISSATSGAKLSAKLTGDVMLPTEVQTGSDLVLLDRYPASVVTWVDVVSAEVEAQLSVRSGFDANPHDYLALGDGRALVTRFHRNPDASAGPLDRGDDVLVIDPAGPAAVASIDLSSAMAGVDPKYHASPHRMLRLGDKVLVSLLGEAAGYADAAPTRLALIEPNSATLEDVLVLEGLYECNGLAAAPDGKRVAVSCSGRFGGGSAPAVQESAVVVVALGPKLEEVTRAPAAPGMPFAFGVAWAGPNTLVANTFGRLADGGPPMPDKLIELTLPGLGQRELLEGEAFSLGDVRCAAACATCFASDAGRGVLHRFGLDDQGNMGAPSAVDVNDPIGLPPRFLGQF